jgi:pyruvate dehydrogenase E1 component beta subunit
VVIVEESWPFGAVCTEIAYRIQKDAFDYMDAPVRRVNGADSSMHYAPNLVEAYLPTVAKVVKVVKEVLYR